MKRIRDVCIHTSRAEGTSANSELMTRAGNTLLLTVRQSEHRTCRSVEMRSRLHAASCQGWMEKNRLRDCCYYPFDVSVLLDSQQTTTVISMDAFHAALHFAFFIWGYISGGGVEYHQCSPGCPQITELKQTTRKISFETRYG